MGPWSAFIRLVQPKLKAWSTNDSSTTPHSPSLSTDISNLADSPPPLPVAEYITVDVEGTTATTRWRIAKNGDTDNYTHQLRLIMTGDKLKYVAVAVSSTTDISTMSKQTLEEVFAALTILIQYHLNTKSFFILGIEPRGVKKCPTRTGTSLP